MFDQIDEEFAKFKAESQMMGLAQVLQCLVTMKSVLKGCCAIHNTYQQTKKQNHSRLQ